MNQELPADITRRDFSKGALLGSGLALLGAAAPLLSSCDGSAPQAGDAINPWNGFAGVGDYARSNGNVEATREAAHLIRDQKIDALMPSAIDTGEVFDMLIIGGGFSGLSAARTFLREADPKQTCLLLENHPLPGGEAKRNAFEVDGYVVMGPQGSNLSVVPSTKGDWYDTLWSELGIPRAPKFQPLTGVPSDLIVCKANYLPMFGLAEQTATAGYYFDKESFGGKSYWDVDSSETDYVHTPFSDAEKADLVRLHKGTGNNRAGDDWERWLDSISYRDYLEKTLGIQPRIISMLNQTLSTTGGLGSDAASALFALKSGLPGFDKGFGDAALYRFSPEDRKAEGCFSFPGGNDAVYRLLLKRVIPAAISGGDSFDEIHGAPYKFENFDRKGERVRIRLNATAVRVEHLGPSEQAGMVRVAYEKEGRVYIVRARGVVSAAGGWVNKHIIRDLPEAHNDAFNSFIYGSNMIVNVALRNWKFLAKLGISAFHYFGADGLGAFGNIKHPMAIGSEQDDFSPDKPVVMTFYIGFPNPGLPALEQAAQNRWSLLSKSYAEIETAMRQQMFKMFAEAGFDAERDIAGITVNRWGHSYIVCPPGFFFGTEGKEAPLDVVKRRFGRIAFGHAEQNGLQEWFGGVENGERAARQILELL